MELYRFHWDLNAIYAHNFVKVQLLKAHLAVHKFVIICLSETYLNSSFPFDDGNLDIPSYIMIRVDHPANTKRGAGRVLAVRRDGPRHPVSHRVEASRRLSSLTGL